MKWRAAIAIVTSCGCVSIGSAFAEAPAAPETLLLSEGQPFTELVYEPRPTQSIERSMGLASWRVRFPSPVRTAVERNNTIDGVLFAPDATTDRAVIFLPWFKDRDTETAELICRQIAAGGLQVFFMPMGYQFGRAPEGHGSGSYITKGGTAAHLEEWIRQAVLDVQRTREWLMRERGIAREKIGIVGVSLGGFIAGLSYGVVRDFPAATVVLAGGNLAKYLRFGAELGITQVTEGLERLAIGPDELERLLAPYDPITYADPARRDGLYLVNGIFDPVVPLPLALDLWEAYGKPDRMLLPSGHVTTAAFGPVVLFEIVRHMRKRL